jgi:phosphoribosylanthranilate isomerase
LIKALTVDRANVDLAEAYAAAAYILVDLPKGSAPPDEAAAACIAAARALTAAGHDVLLAGGLTAQDVRAACAAARPFGVDVASGIERSPGRKDPDQTRAFIREATG